MPSELLPPTNEEIVWAGLSQTVRVSAGDFEDYERILRDPRNSPLGVMQVERQQRNDCQGNATANGEECRSWVVSGRRVMPVLSEMYAYNASEYLMSPQYVGRDSGTSMHSGVRLLTEGIPRLGVKPGVATEANWPYAQYFRSASQFEAAARRVEIVPSHVTEHGPLPSWQGMLAAVAAGGTGHIGTFWSVRWSNLNGRRLMDTLPTGGGGHATEIIWAEEIQGRWYLCVWNSHGDGYYYMSQRCYEQLLARRGEPFGCFVLMPDRAQERYYSRMSQGGGYFA